MEPINYNIDVKTPFESVVQGFQAGAGMQQVQQQQAAQQLALQQKQQMNQDLSAVMFNPNASGKDYAALTMKYPALKEQFKQSWDMVHKDQQTGKLDMMTRAYSALSTGRADIAEKLMRDNAAAMRNSGAPDHDVKAQEMWADMIKTSPDHARHVGGLMLSSVMDPDKFAATFATVGDQGRASDKAPGELTKTTAETENVISQIKERSGRLALDQDKLQSEVQLKLHELGQKSKTLTDDARKIVNESAVAAVAADQSAAQMLSLADRMEKETPVAGVIAKGGELYKTLSGDQDAITHLRQEYTRLRSKQVLSNLPPGPASDKDIMFAAKGFPEDTANVATMAQFIRGMAKIQQFNGVMEVSKSEWVNAVGHLGKPKTDIDIDGVKVPAGSTFTDFSRQFFKQKTEKRAADQSAQQIQGRSYLRFAQPGAQ